MGWKIAREYVSEWKAANARAQEREDEIRRPPSDDYYKWKEAQFRDGEAARFRDIERNLLNMRQSSIDTRDREVFNTIKKTVKSSYERDAGDAAPLSDGAVNAVSWSIARPLIVYNRLPPGLLAVTKEEKEVVIAQAWWDRKAREFLADTWVLDARNRQEYETETDTMMREEQERNVDLNAMTPSQKENFELVFPYAVQNDDDKDWDKVFSKVADTARYNVGEEVEKIEEEDFQRLIQAKLKQVSLLHFPPPSLLCVFEVCAC